jgi:hemerythrin-like metal-binding protein
MGPYISWKQSYTVYDSGLDAQHKQIIETMNDLHSAMKGGDAVVATRRAMDLLVRYTHVHFANEERVLKEVAYPDFIAHKALHDQMRRRTIALSQNLNLVTARDMIVLLKDWWLDHIQGEDKKYSAYLGALAMR